jgi:hypothetical protein
VGPCVNSPTIPYSPFTALNANYIIFRNVEIFKKVVCKRKTTFEISNNLFENFNISESIK